MIEQNFELSDYQKAIVDFVRNERGNLLVDAKAGSGKTSTLLLIAGENIAKNNKCLFLAFNKHIQEELDSKIRDDRCVVRTVHSLGYSFISSYLYKKYGKDNYVLKIEKGKTRALVKEYYDKYFRKRIDLFNATGLVDDTFITSDMDNSANALNLSAEALKELHNDLITDFTNLCNFSRYYNVNYKQDRNGLKKLVNRFCWNLKPYTSAKPEGTNCTSSNLLYDFENLVIAVIDKIKELFEYPVKDELTNKPLFEIDYTDMIYLPVIYQMSIPYSLIEFTNTILVDECQDLSILQQNFIRMLQTNFNRFIFVGDKFQSIYGFAGADTQAVEELKKTFVLKHLPLNICYRCPEKVVKLAKGIVPAIEWNTKREDTGKVELVTPEFMYENIKAGDILVGRKNKDLLKVYRKFALKLKKPVKFRNSELVSDLCRNLDKAMEDYMTLYAKGINVIQLVNKHMAEFSEETQLLSDEPEYKTEMNRYTKELISNNSGKSERRLPANPDLEYLEK